MKRNILLTIAYDGTGFSGWQRQPELRTVQGELEAVLSKICACDIRIDGTSRTDAGVHALGQRATFQGDFGIPTDKIAFAANNMLAGSMNVRQRCADAQIVKAEDVPEGFHARFDSKGKKYRYIIKDDGGFDVFRRNYCYETGCHLDEKKMQEAADCIVGTHDFACFQSAGGNIRETTVRTVSALTVSRSPAGDVLIEIIGDGFLYNMVRIIAGTLVEVGQGKRRPEEIEDIIASGDRTRAGHTAPAEGLYLVEVYFDEKLREEAAHEQICR